MGLTRRKFLAGIVLGGTGALAAGMTGCAAKTQDAELSSGSKDASDVYKRQRFSRSD